MTQADASRATEAEGSTPPSGHFTRSYMACERCRRRKVKCVVQQNPPCAKCKREHRTCVFPQHRTTRKQREPPNWATPPGQQQDHHVFSSESQMCPTDAGLGMLEGSASAELLMEDSVAHARAQQSLLERAVPSVMLHSGASPIFSGRPRQGTEPVISRPNPPWTLEASCETLSTSNLGQVPVVPTVVNELCQASEELVSVWNKCRFVRQGWLTAQAAITYVEL
jgi:hypothetical protein